MPLAHEATKSMDFYFQIFVVTLICETALLYHFCHENFSPSLASVHGSLDYEVVLLPLGHEKIYVTRAKQLTLEHLNSVFDF